MTTACSARWTTTYDSSKPAIARVLLTTTALSWTCHSKEPQTPCSPEVHGAGSSVVGPDGRRGTVAVFRILSRAPRPQAPWNSKQLQAMPEEQIIISHGGTS